MCVVIEIGVGQIKHQRLGWNYAYCHTADGIALIAVGHIIKVVLAYTGIGGKVDPPSQHTGGNINGVIDEIVDGVISAKSLVSRFDILDSCTDAANIHTVGQLK